MTPFQKAQSEKEAEALNLVAMTLWAEQQKLPGDHARIVLSYRDGLIELMGEFWINGMAGSSWLNDGHYQWPMTFGKDATEWSLTEKCRHLVSDIRKKFPEAFKR